jgi:uncharacterized protein
MNTTIFCQSEAENKIKYFYDMKQNFFCFMHPLLFYYYLADNNMEMSSESFLFKDSFSDFEKEYYREKYQFLRTYGFFQQMVYQNETKDFMNDGTVSALIYNLNQIVFEVTDACNLKCKYCAYGDMYYDYDKRIGKNIPFHFIKNTIDYLLPLISKSNDILYISFYGGEPLLNFDSIKQTVEYVKSICLERQIVFTMTTNGILLDKYIDFLKDNGFKILVSIDGNEYNHSYRVFQSGKSSFNKLMENLHLIKNKYSQYFDKNVEFNTILHNRNSMEEAHNFLYKEFGKVTALAPLDNAGIHPDKMPQFQEMYHDIQKELEHITDMEYLINQQFAKNPLVYNIAIFLKARAKNTSFEFYEDILSSRNSRSIPSGTCLPFQKKMFVTVNGKILPCERINQEYTLGYVNEDGVILDYAEIARQYNFYYAKFVNQCTQCYHYEDCTQCFFQIDNLNRHYQCTGFANAARYAKYLGGIISALEENNQILTKIIKEIVIK